MRYSDCYPGCGGEDCPCCEIHINHVNNYGHDQFYPHPRPAYPCDGPEMQCPFDAKGGMDCQNYCGLGVDK